MYIPPANSIYYKKDYFNQLEIIIHHYKLKKVILVGDLNARFGTPAPHYRQNPDVILNNHGRKLINICNLHGFHIVNGLDSECDTKFTCFKGKLRSQNDICVTNYKAIIKNFHIMNKQLFSHHSPCDFFSTRFSLKLFNFISE